MNIFQLEKNCHTHIALINDPSFDIVSKDDKSFFLFGRSDKLGFISIHVP